MKVCPKCQVNYIINEQNELCELCQKIVQIDPKPKDENKREVERYLIPILREMSEAAVESLTTKEESFALLGLRLPLLIKCKCEGVDCCNTEIKDRTGHNRYYINPYSIGEKKYHVCSQWWSAENNHSKDILQLLKNLENKD